MPFAIEDASGTIALDLTHVQLSLRMAPAQLAQHGPERVFGAEIIAANQYGRMENNEGGVVPGNRLTVSGRVTRGAGGALVLAGTAADPVVMVALR